MKDQAPSPSIKRSSEPGWWQAAGKIRVLFLCLLLGWTVGCDQTTKHVARKELQARGSIELPGGMGRLQIAENPGSFLGLGDSMSGLVRRWIFTVGVGIGLVGLAVYLILSSGLTWLNFLGLTLILAGGLGNLIDRLLQGGLVTDFIYLCAGPFHTGIFNVADMMIMLGGLVVVISLGRSNSPSKAASTQIH